MDPPPGLDWLCVSPKAGTELKIRSGHELKLAFPQEYIVGADYFRTLGVTLLRGREFTAAEEIGSGGTPPVTSV